MFEKYPLVYKLFDKLKQNNNISHAYIIESNENNDGLEVAKELTKTILCLNHTKNYREIKQIEAETHPDFKIITPIGNTIKKEQLIDLQEEFSKKSFLGTRRVYIISESDKLNISSSNSILKFLEEPVVGVTAILIVNNRFQLLDTILSRCQIITLPKLQLESLETKQNLINITSSNEMKSSIFEEEGIEIIIKFIELLEENKIGTIMYLNKYLLKYYKQKEEVLQFLIAMIYFYRDVLNYLINIELNVFNDYRDVIVKIGNMNNLELVTKKIECLNKCRKNVSSNANINLALDKLIIDMVGE